MSEERIISGENEEQIVQQLTVDFETDAHPLQYHAVLVRNERRVLLDIATDPEQNFALTTFNAYLYSRNDFRFVIYKESVIDEIGKFFGMQDVILGYSEFDDHFIVKTNMEERTAVLFADPAVRETLQSIPGLSFGIVQYTLDNEDGKAPFLELKITEAIHDPLRLEEIYKAFFKVLLLVEN